jgi:predicted AlkP superfamily phosphohydrolase/phosphomutase
MKILIIGLDAATMDLIDPWVAASHLPTLASLIEKGVSARLRSTPNMHSASAWTSILTGLSPGRHGLFVFSDRNFQTGRQEFFKGGDRAGETFAAHLARHELTSGFLNVPMTYPAEATPGGFMISGLDAPSLNEQAFNPPELRRELFDRFPDYNFTPVGLGDMMSAGRVESAVAAWMKLTHTQTAAAEYLIASRPTDFFMTVYTASDWAGHNLWENPARPDSALLAVYKALDDAIARLIALADDQTQIYVISDHGMGPHTGASYHLARWLEEKGYMVRKRSTRNRASLIDASRRAAKNLLPVRLKETIKSNLGADRLKRLQTVEKDSFYDSIDWERTECYTEPGRHVININLAGRNPQGTVASENYEQVCNRLIEDLNEWRDARGNRVVEKTARRDEVYSGPFVDRASDLYVYWNAQAAMGEPPPEVRERKFWWKGDHRLDGILISKGPGIRRGSRIETASVYDLLPTIMYAAGLPVPANLDGRALKEIFADEFVEANPLNMTSPAESPAADRETLTENEERLIEEKLRSLGYL